MTILNAILELAAELTGITEDKLKDWREHAQQETGDDDVRLTRERQLDSWTGSSTPISQQIRDSEQHFHNLLDAAVPDIKELLPRLFALELKRQRIDRLKEEHAAKRATSLTGSNGGLHEDYIALARLLQRLGAGPSKVRQWAIEDLAIIADLARWKAEDPRYKNGDNPWVAIRAIYAHRTLEKRGKNETAGAMSIPGPPPPDGKWEFSAKFWRFGNGDAPYHRLALSEADVVAKEAIVAEEPAPSTGQRAHRPSAESGNGLSPPSRSSDGRVGDIDAGGASTEDRPDLVASRMVAAASLAAGSARLAATGERWDRPNRALILPGALSRKVGDAEPALRAPESLDSAADQTVLEPHLPLSSTVTPPPDAAMTVPAALNVTPLTSRVHEPSLTEVPRHSPLQKEPVLIETDEDMAWPEDVTMEARRAYFELAKQLAKAFEDWQEHTWPFAKADPANPQSVADLLREFEAVERSGKIDQVSSQYLSILRSGSLDEANDFLIDRYARQLLPKVLNHYDYEDDRRQAGFPRSSRAIS